MCSASLSACHDSCSTCEGPLATHCTSCSFPLALHLGQCLQGCGEGFYWDHNVCKGKLCTWSKFPGNSKYTVNQCIYWLLLGCAWSTQLRCWSFVLCWTGQWVIPVLACWLFSTLRRSQFSQILSVFTPSGFSDLGDLWFSLCCWNKGALLPSFSWCELRGGRKSTHT